VAAWAVAKFRLSASISVDLVVPRRLFLDAVARQRTSRKLTERGPKYKQPVTIDGFVVPELAHALLREFAKETGQKIQKITNPSNTAADHLLELYDQEQIARLVMLHVSRHEHGVGTLRIHCGSASHEDMLMVIAPFGITYHEPHGTKGMPALGGRGFKVKLTTVKFNEPDWPAIPNGKDQLNIDDQNNLVAHAKDELKQSHPSGVLSVARQRLALASLWQQRAAPGTGAAREE
jgi:hypothetical protein